MKEGKCRMWTTQDGEDFVESLNVGELGRQIAKEINKHIKTQNEMAKAIEGFTDYGKPLVVDEYLLDEVLEVVNCQRCPCEKYCSEQNMYTSDDCAKARKLYLLGKLKEHMADTEEEEE